MSETAALAEYAARLRYEDIPEEVLERARNTICDTVASATRDVERAIRLLGDHIEISREHTLGLRPVR